MDENPGMVDAERIKLGAQSLGMDPDILRRAQENFMAQLSEEDLLANEWAKAQERRLRARMAEAYSLSGLTPFYAAAIKILFGLKEPSAMEEPRDMEAMNRGADAMREFADEMRVREGQILDDALDERARASKKNRNADIMERTLSLAVRAEDLAGEVTYNSATEAGAREKIDAFQAHMKAGAEMGKELLALFKA